MRLTVEDAEKRGLIGKVKVKVDGKYVRGVIVADEEQGYVECYKRKDGELVVNHALEKVECEIIKGHVEIEFNGKPIL